MEYGMHPPFKFYNAQKKKKKKKKKEEEEGRATETSNSIWPNWHDFINLMLHTPKLNVSFDQSLI